MAIDGHHVLHAQCAAAAVRVLKDFERDPHQSPEDVAKLATFIWCVISRSAKPPEAEMAQRLDQACAYAVAADALARAHGPKPTGNEGKMVW